MCCCPKPSINGEPNAYSWDGKSLSTRPIHAPTLADGDVLLYDEPGRCGGIDSHSHHLRLVKSERGYALLVRHGGGDERLSMGRSYRRNGSEDFVSPLAAMDSNARYWFLLRFYYMLKDAAQAARDETEAKWRKAAAEKRIKTRKLRKHAMQGAVKVWIEEEGAQKQYVTGKA